MTIREDDDVEISLFIFFPFLFPLFFYPPYQLNVRLSMLIITVSYEEVIPLTMFMLIEKSEE